ncbi:hypothetical protein BLOT_003655, partial [Blomia tropicalis]
HQLSNYIEIEIENCKREASNQKNKARKKNTAINLIQPLHILIRSMTAVRHCTSSGHQYHHPSQLCH